MFHEVVLTRVIQDKNGVDKQVTERYFTENKRFLCESEQALLEYFNCECEITSIKQSKLKEFVNERTNEEQDIYIITLEAIFTDENGEESSTKYDVGLFATSVPEATNIAQKYCQQGLDDLNLISVKRTKWCDIIK